MKSREWPFSAILEAIISLQYQLFGSNDGLIVAALRTNREIHKRDAVPKFRVAFTLTNDIVRAADRAGREEGKLQRTDEPIDLGAVPAENVA